MAKITITGTMARKGASVKRNLFALAGVKSSLKIIFTASAMKWKMPQALKPRMAARFGPRRSCIIADSRRSAQVSSDANGITSTRMSSANLMSPWHHASMIHRVAAARARSAATAEAEDADEGRSHAGDGHQRNENE